MQEEKQEKKSGWQSFRELIFFALVSLAIVAPIRIFIAQPFIVSGSSMFPTFENSEYLIVDELSYRLGDPQRDDVVIFRYPNDTTKFFIKRIIGLPNDTIDIKGGVITITNKANLNGFTLKQPFIKNPSTGDNIHFVLKDNEYFVMGDNRNASSDSRYWGAVPRQLLIGRAFLRLFPLNKIDILPGNYKQE
jgi:signal peptidase I